MTNDGKRRKEKPNIFERSKGNNGIPSKTAKSNVGELRVITDEMKLIRNIKQEVKQIRIEL